MYLKSLRKDAISCLIFGLEHLTYVRHLCNFKRMMIGNKNDSMQPLSYTILLQVLE